MSKPTAFPLDESKLPFTIPKDQPFRENIAKLGQMITDRIPAKKGPFTGNSGTVARADIESAPTSLSRP